MDNRRDDEVIQEAVRLAKAWQQRANALLTAEEKGIQEQLKRLLTHPEDKVILTQLIDQSFRSSNPARIADQVNYLLHANGVPDFFNQVEKLLIQMFLGLGRHFPALAVPKMIEKMRHNSSRAVIPGEPDALNAHLRKRRKQGVPMNINHLGEAVLGEEEARHRLRTYIRDLKNPNIETISVKISTIYSQISSLALEPTVATLVKRLAALYRVAKSHFFVRADGSRSPKFVNLDMEEYRDMEITYSAFVQTLDQAEFQDASAGIVLQAYLPDAHLLQKKLTQWARDRVAGGGASVKLRIVKGANMEMEQLESALFNWPLAPYDTKPAVDANYKRMVAYGMAPDNIRAVNLGIASHNLFELAYAYTVGRANGVTDFFCFEMLEGMADHVRRALFELAGDVLLYAPVAGHKEFLNAIAYLVRRLDENTAPENFLRYAPDLTVGSGQWDFLEKGFIASCALMDTTRLGPSRIQDRNTEIFADGLGTYHTDEFTNEPDTDWALAANRIWAEHIRDRWKKSPDNTPVRIPVVVAGKEHFDGRKTRDCLDPSQYTETVDKAVRVAVWAIAGDGDVDSAVAAAKADPDRWRAKTMGERHEVLSRVAVELRNHRGDLIGAAAANTGKVFTEADVEVSEAVDFAEYYPYAAAAFANRPHIDCRGKGVGVVISPWNFPIAIPCGGITASLAAGNTVIFKPSSDAVLVAWQLCRCFWRAGVSRNVLQFLPCEGASAGTRLTGHKDVDFVILTGGTETGLEILSHRPDLFLAAETGGKNATIVTAMADRGQAIKNVVHSAFGNCGQKCSATSLLILEREVYSDADFKHHLVDAARSWAVGSAWEFQNKMAALIRPPSGALSRALTERAPGESWALKPKAVEGNPFMWTPGIKWGVNPGSTDHMTEFFGPVLGVMCAENLEHAIKLANGTGYGLTSGLESLDKREQEKWKSGIRAGNLYINRGTTGAVTLRQPFGGTGKSSIGPGIKAGGPFYVTQFMDVKDRDFPRIDAAIGDHWLLQPMAAWRRKIDWGRLAPYKKDLYQTVRAVKSYLFHHGREFGVTNDYFHLRGQDNLLRYLPVGKVVVRLHENDSLFEALARIAAALICGCPVVTSISTGLDNGVTAFLMGKEGKFITDRAPIRFDSDADLIGMIPKVQRIRYAAPARVPPAVSAAAAKVGCYIARAPVLMEGRIELLHYLWNQSICDMYHRYGNLGERAV